MGLETWAIKVLSFLIGLMFSEIIADFLLVKYEKKNGKPSFKLRFNFEALNPFIAHDKAISAYIIQIISVGILTIFIENIFIDLISNAWYFWIPMLSLTSLSLYILAIKKLKVGMNKKRWIIFSFLSIITIGLFLLIYWLRHPNTFD